MDDVREARMSDMSVAIAYAPRCVQVLHERDGRCLAKYAEGAE